MRHFNAELNLCGYSQGGRLSWVEASNVVPSAFRWTGMYFQGRVPTNKQFQFYSRTLDRLDYGTRSFPSYQISRKLDMGVKNKQPAGCLASIQKMLPSLSRCRHQLT